MSHTNDIWNNEKGGLSEERLMAYLNGKLSPEEQHDVERLLAEESMESDAIEGLKDLSPENTTLTVQKLNKTLHQLTHKRKRQAIPFGENKWAWLAVFLILLLAILGYWVLHLAAR